MTLPVPEGAARVAVACAQAASAGDFVRLWSLFDGNVKECTALAWLHANRAELGRLLVHRPNTATDSTGPLTYADARAVALALIEQGSTHPLWPHMAAAQGPANAASVPPWFLTAVVSRGRRPVARGFEAVCLHDPAGSPGYFVVLTTVVEGSWRVAGVNYTPPVPGWPPTPASSTA